MGLDRRIVYVIYLQQIFLHFKGGRYEGRSNRTVPERIASARRSKHAFLVGPGRQRIRSGGTEGGSLVPVEGIVQSDSAV